MQKDYEKLQYHEQRETNLWLIVNTVATVIMGIASIIIALVMLFK